MKELVAILTFRSRKYAGANISWKRRCASAAPATTATAIKCSTSDETAVEKHAGTKRVIKPEHDSAAEESAAANKDSHPN